MGLIIRTHYLLFTYIFPQYTIYLLIIYLVGCDLVLFPAAFHITTGPQYWELVHRARAIDNQFFVAAISPARNEQANYVVYGHSMIIDPIGNILAQANTSEEIVFYEIGKNSE